MKHHIYHKTIFTIAYKQAAVASGSLADPSQVMREIDLSPGQPLQSASSSGSLGVIGRRSVSDLGAIGDYISATTPNSGAMHDQSYNLQMLEAAYYRLPQPKDSERAKTYTPVCNAVFLFSFWSLSLLKFLSNFLLMVCAETSGCNSSELSSSTSPYG